MMNPRELGRYLLDVRNDNRIRPVRQAGSISYANWWEMQPEEYWFTRFVRHHYPEETGAGTKPIRFYSVFGPKDTIKEPFAGIKIFYSGENLEEFERFPGVPIRKVSDAVWHARKRKFDGYGFGTAALSMGFPREEAMEGAGRKGTRYLRFPLWITYLFEPEDDYEAIAGRIAALNRQANPVSSRGIACIASHDFYGTRQMICNALEESGLEVLYAGRWRHNTDALQEKFGDDKLSFLHSVRFNICPENTDTKDYVTEKLFDAFQTGVIPIYHGAGNDPEPGLINRDAVLFWGYRENEEASNRKTLSLIRELSEDESAYLDFMRQERLTGKCADYAWQCMVSLKDALGELLQG